MSGLLGSIAFFASLFVAAMAVVVFLRALSVRLMVGKWPHQSDEAKRIFDSLP